MPATESEPPGFVAIGRRVIVGAMNARTHQRIDRALVGELVELGEGAATCELETSAAMAADERGLVHGGFVFGLADYAAMLAVNDSNVVLGAAETRFIAPVEVGQRVTARAEITAAAGKKRIVEVRCQVAGAEVLAGTFTCFVLDRHVLDAKEPR